MLKLAGGELLGFYVIGVETYTVNWYNTPVSSNFPPDTMIPVSHMHTFNLRLVPWD